MNLSNTPLIPAPIEVWRRGGRGTGERRHGSGLREGKGVGGGGRGKKEESEEEGVREGTEQYREEMDNRIG